MEDAEKLRLYAQSAVSKHHALEDSLGKAKSRAKHWERKAKEGTERIMGAEKDMDESKEEAHIAQLAAVATGDAKAMVEDDLSRVQVALEIVEEARLKVEAAHLEVERTYLLLEIGAVKDEVSSF